MHNLAPGEPKPLDPISAIQLACKLMNTRGVVQVKITRLGASWEVTAVR